MVIYPIEVKIFYPTMVDIIFKRKIKLEK